MKRFKKSCILVLVIAFFIAIFPVGTFADVPDPGGGHAGQETAATVYITIFDLTANKPSANPYPTPPDEEDTFEVTLTPDTGFSLPESITVQRENSETGSMGEFEYTPDTHYTYDSTSGEVVIFGSTLREMFFDSSGENYDPPHPIRIMAAGISGTSTFSITVTQGANGTISPASATGINKGDDLTFTITPNSGFRIANVLVDGTSVGNVSSYTFSNINSNHTIRALFERASGGTDSSDSSGSSGSSGSSEISVSSNDSDDDFPKTGDSLSLFFWLMSGISAASITAIIMIRKKFL